MKKVFYRRFLPAVVIAGSSLAVPAFSANLPSPVQAVAQPASQQRLAVAGIDHVGINVPDVAVAAAFFADLLGARVVSDMRPGKIPDGWKNAFNWHTSSEIDRIVMMQLQDGSRIELFQYSGPDISSVRPHEDDAAETHIALKTTDIDHSIAVLKNRGLRILNEPVTLPDGERWFYFLTPWNSQLELVFASKSK